MNYVICYDSPNGIMYLTSLPNDENPFSGIGFQGGGNDPAIPRAAGNCPSIEDAQKIIAYLNEEQDGYYEQRTYYYKEDTREQK